MSERDYYPAGAYSDPNAPYNQKSLPEKEFDVVVIATLSRNVTICTDDYCAEYDEEDGHTYVDTRDTDWDKAYKENGYLSIQEMMQELRQYAEQEIKDHPKNSKRYNRLKCIIESTEDWEADDLSFEY